MRSPRTVKLACAAAIVALVAPAGAHAQPGWQLPPAQLAGTVQTPEFYYQPVVAAGADGSATALLSRWTGSTSNLSYTDRPPGGAWSEPAAMPTEGKPYAAQIAGDAGSGTQLAGWLDSASGSAPFTVHVSRRRVGGAWEPAVELAPYGGPEDQVVSAPSVVQDPAGDALAVWVEADESFSSEWLVAAEWRGGSWGPSQRISAPATDVQLSDGTSVASDGPGDFIVGWLEEPKTTPGSFDAVIDTLTPEGWTGAQTVGYAPDFMYGLSLSANQSGQGAAVWADAETDTVWGAALMSGGWTQSSPASTHIRTVCEEAPPQVGTDLAGTSTAMWVEAGGGVTSEEMAPGGSWKGDRVTVADVPEQSRRSVSLAVGGDGSALASWAASSFVAPYGSSLYVDSRAAGGAWGAPVTLASGAGYYPSRSSLALAADGFGVAGWEDETEVPGSKEERWDSTPRAIVFEAPVATSSGAPIASGAPAATVPRRLGPVYLQVPKHRLWLARHGHTVSAAIRNSNPFPVSGTARIYEYLMPHGKRAHASSLALAGLVHYRLGAHQTKPVSFRIGGRALHRLHAIVPDRGHILVEVRLWVQGEAQHAQSSVVMALDQRLARHRGHLRRPKIPAGYPAPVDPWARKAC